MMFGESFITNSCLGTIVYLCCIMLTLRVEWPNSVEWGGFWLIFDSLDDWLSKDFVCHLL